MVEDMYERLTTTAKGLKNGTKKGVTLSPWDFTHAIRLVVPGELGRHAINEGYKALTRYQKSTVNET